MHGGHSDFIRHLVLCSNLFILMICTTKIYHWINSKLKSDWKNPQKMMKYNFKKNRNLAGS
jgi:uncharacterized Fe-S radical SAM superfamily protein PflX